MNIDPQTLAQLTSSQIAKSALRDLGCTLDPARDRLWIVPTGKLRAARRIARENLYPAAFRAMTTIQTND